MKREKWPKNVYIIVILLVMTEFFWINASGWNDYSVPLPNGYELVRTNAPSIFIFRPYRVEGIVVKNSAVVPPKITALGVFDDIVFGKTEDSPEADDWGPASPGFFILDTKNHKVQLGLDKGEWLESLQKEGVTEEPSLEKPSRNFQGVENPKVIPPEEEIKRLESEIEVLKLIILEQSAEIERLRALCIEAGIDIEHINETLNDPNHHTNQKRSMEESKDAK